MGARQTAALHEASHACVAIALGVGGVVCEVTPSGGGRTWHSHATPWQELLITAAGEVGEGLAIDLSAEIAQTERSAEQATLEKYRCEYEADFIERGLSDREARERFERLVARFSLPRSTQTDFDCGREIAKAHFGCVTDQLWECAKDCARLILIEYRDFVERVADELITRGALSEADIRELTLSYQGANPHARR